MEGSDQVVGGVGGAVKAVCVKRAGYKGESEARCVGVGRKKIRRILRKLKGVCSRAAGGGGEMERFEEGGEEVYRM